MLFHFRFGNSVLCSAMWLILCKGGSFISVMICILFVKRYIEYIKIGNCHTMKRGSDKMLMAFFEVFHEEMTLWAQSGVRL